LSSGRYWDNLLISFALQGGKHANALNWAPLGPFSSNFNHSAPRKKELSFDLKFVKCKFMDALRVTSFNFKLSPLTWNFPFRKVGEVGQAAGADSGHCLTVNCSFVQKVIGCQRVAGCGRHGNGSGFFCCLFSSDVNCVNAAD
jgi:hypothetical protein